MDRLINEARIPPSQQPGLPIIYLWTFKKIVVMKRNITGFTLVPDGLIRFTGVKVLAAAIGNGAAK